MPAIRLIKHEAIPKCGSFEVRFPDGARRRGIEGEREANVSNDVSAKLVIAALLLSTFTLWRASDRVRGSCHRHCPTDISAIRR
jgi:hypothetical protein